MIRTRQLLPAILAIALVVRIWGLGFGLPDIDGFAVADHLAARPRSPVVVLTSSREESTYAERLAATPARGFIAKRDLSGAALATLLR